MSSTTNITMLGRAAPAAGASGGSGAGPAGSGAGPGACSHFPCACFSVHAPCLWSLAICFATHARHAAFGSVLQPGQYAARGKRRVSDGGARRRRG